VVEVLAATKALVEFGVTPNTVIALVIMWKLNKTFNGIDKRLAIVETKLDLK